jgi:hypothetical protein
MKQLAIKRLHVRANDAQALSGAAAIVEIWVRLPRCRVSASTVCLSPCRPYQVAQGDDAPVTAGLVSASRRVFAKGSQQCVLGSSAQG